MRKPSVAIIDIGSNSIKLLVAQAGPHGLPVATVNRTLDVRISAGIGQDEPRLSEEGMLHGLGAVRELLSETEPYSPNRIAIVATSAVRDAANGGEFCGRILKHTRHPVRILTGSEEAALIGRGLTCDPALEGLQDFYVFDLGGGSLECLSFQKRKITQSVSLQLGCVRLTELFIKDPEQPFPATAGDEVAKLVRAELAKAGFAFGLPAGAAAVATGGSMTTARTVLAALKQRMLRQTPPRVEVAELQKLLEWLGPMPAAERRTIPGLPPPRADVFPAALATLITLAELGNLTAFHHSFFNLRFGLAADELAKIRQ